MPCRPFGVLQGSCAVAVSLLWSAATSATELITDRPDETESPHVIEPQQVQLETGYLFARDSGESTHYTFNTLLRVGFLPWTELRLEWQGYQWAPGPNGASDPTIGMKGQVWAEAFPLPAVALYGRTSVPIGGDAQTSGRFDPAVALFLSNTLSDVFAIGYNFGVRWRTSEASDGSLDTEAAGYYTLAPSMRVTHAAGVFVESFGDVGLEGQDSNVSIDAGATFLVHPLVQLDVFSGFGVTADATDFFAGGGLSFRVPD